MGLHKLKRGLRLPILGEPVQEIDAGRMARRVAILGGDYVGMRPTMKVGVGESVKRGQVLFEDKKMPGVFYTSPGAGTVAAIHRGERRAFQAVVIELSRSEREGRGDGADEVSYRSFSGKHPDALDGDQVRELLIESGLWTALRARPYGRVANPEGSPKSIFVTAMDSNPLAARTDVILAGREADLERGVAALARLTEGPVFVCTDDSTQIDLPEGERYRLERFSGPHPAGTAGVHIHHLDPVDRNKIVWHVGFQDVLAIGVLFDKGKAPVERIVSLAGPSVKNPRLVKTRLGVSLDDLSEDELREGENRVVSGSVFSGTTAEGDRLGYLGRYHSQVSVLSEGREREFFGWISLGSNKFSVINTFISSMIPGKRFDFTTTTNGSHRAIIPLGMYEKVLPMDLEPTFLLKALVMGDVETAERMGCLELGEEDVALCTFVCPGKNEYGSHLRDVLTTIEKEG